MQPKVVSRRRCVSSLGGFLVLALILLVGEVQAQQETSPTLTRPLLGLTPAQLDAFTVGRAEFERQWRPREGLGPQFNGVACATCHHIPDTGGAGPRYRSNFNFGFLSTSGFNPLTEKGGPLLQELTLAGVAHEQIPLEANVFSLRRVAPLFGLGLAEAIPDGQISARADENDINGDGISGRAVFTNNGRVQRFGSQDHVASLRSFVVKAMEEEIGLTQTEAPPQTATLMRSFISFLAPVPRGPITEDVTVGEAVFNRINCAGCHTPSFTTAPGPFTTADGEVIDVAALQNQTIFPYSDFLLHDLGPELDDGVTLGSARTSEYRTIPLWGLRFRGNFLHDNRAANLRQTILFHGGEARAAREAFLGLNQQELRQLEAFLNSL